MARLQSIRGPLVLLALVAGALAVLIVALLAPSADRRAAIPQPAPVRSRACVPATPCLALLIDDLGRRPALLRQLLALPLDLTYSVLPHARHSALALLALRASGREYWLHLPLQPLDPRMITDEPVVLTANGPIEAAFATCAAAVPGAFGANGHMGSAFTANRGAATRLLRQLQLHGLPVLDSKTTADSVVCATAAALKLPCLERDVFLDDPSDPAKVGRRLEAAIALARRRGWAVAVGHPESETIRALRKLVGSPAARMIIRLSGVFASRGILGQGVPSDRERPLTRQTPGT